MAISNINRSAWGAIHWTENTQALFNPVARWVMIRASLQAIDDKKIIGY